MTEQHPILDRHQLLEEIGAFKKKHSGRTLAEHLLGVGLIMSQWNCPVSWIDAGTFHSIYGTTYFKHQSTDNRDHVREIVGEVAENVIWTFCQLPHPRIDNAIAIEDNDPLRQVLLTIEAANKIDLGKTVPERMIEFLPSEIQQYCHIHNEKLDAESS